MPNLRIYPSSENSFSLELEGTESQEFLERWTGIKFHLFSDSEEGLEKFIAFWNEEGLRSQLDKLSIWGGVSTSNLSYASDREFLTWEISAKNLPLAAKLVTESFFGG